MQTDQPGVALCLLGSAGFLPKHAVGMYLVMGFQRVGN